MSQIKIIRRGEYVKSSEQYSDGNQTHLLHSVPGLELLVEIMPKETIGCYFSLTNEIFEFNYLLRGRIEIAYQGEKIVIAPGDTYAFHATQNSFMFRVLEDSEILCINNDPCFEKFNEVVDHLNNVLSELQKVDGDTLNHCTRVKEYSMGIAYYMQFDQAKLLNLFYASKFHDVGKSKIPLEILLKPSKLNNEEYEIMKKHSIYTYEMILQNYGQDVANMAFEHHEWLNGNGYPRGLKGVQIELGARIICVADAYDAITVSRPYHIGLSKSEAIAELRRFQNIQFDPLVIDALEIYLDSKLINSL